MRKHLALCLFTACLFIGSCADLEDGQSLESIRVVPEYYRAELDSRPKQFTAVGVYNDDSTSDLTDEVEWTDDATGDAMLSSEFPGLVYFRQTGWFAVVAKKTDVTADTEDDEIKGKADVCVYPKDATADCPAP